MCFSPEASFSASAVLGIIGIAAIKKAPAKPFVFLAMIPLLFGIQQLFEGVLWLTLRHGDSPSLVHAISQYGFLTFAYLVWPVWVPFSLYMIEHEAWRRGVIVACLVVGIIVACGDLFSLITRPIESEIVNCSIQYAKPKLFPKLFYAASVLIPCFVSSVRNVWVFGVLVAVSYSVAEYFYQETFTSVWCFFAGIVSLWLYYVVSHATVTSLER